MRKVLFSLLVSMLLVAATFGIFSIARGQIDGASGDQVVASESDGSNTRTIFAPEGAPVGEAPEISFIDSPSVTCFQPDYTQDVCYINWYYQSVDANPNYMIAMTTTLNAIGPVARVGGFFQTSMYVPYSMLGDGFKVACGALGAGGNPALGNAYAWTINARDSANLKSANYGTVYCPAFAP